MPQINDVQLHGTKYDLPQGGSVSPEDIAQAVEDWIEDNPEALTPYDDTEVRRLIAGKVAKPAAEGTAGQVLKNLGNGTTAWANDDTVDNTKVPKPAAEGTSGQVLKTNGNGATYWDNESGADNSKVPKPVTNPDGSSGQVLKSNGDGTTVWGDAATIPPETISSAVDDWLDEHPEAVTTVEDGSITKVKLATALASELDGKAPAIVGNHIDRVQENTSKVTFIGNAYAWGNARYANRENLIKLPDTGAVTVSGVTITSQDGFAFFNGTAASGDDGSQFIMNVDIPAGTYTFTIEPYLGNGEVTKGKNMHLDFYYDGNTSYTQDKRATIEAAGLANKSVNVTLTDHAYKIRLWRSVGANTYDDYRLFYTLFPSDVTITDTQQTVASGATLEYTLPAQMAVVDTMQHKSSVQSILDTKEYIDTKVPKPASNPNGNSGQILQSNGDGSTAWIDYSADMGYITPEMYGAYGDGSHDDSAAIQACIAASQAGINSNKCKAIRGFNKYRLGTGLIFHGREMDVFLNHIVYTPADGPVITISGAMCKFAFGDIRAENESGYDSTTGEGTLPSGIRLCTFVGGTGGMQDGCYDLDISCMYMRTMGPCIEYMATANTTNVVMYHRFHVPYLYSKYSDCIHIGTGIQALNELDFYGKVILAPVGYGFYAEQVGIVRLHQFCFEQNLKNAIGLKSILAGGPVILQECRCRELEDTQTAADHTRGKLYVFDGASTYGIFDEFGGSMDVTAIDVSNALTLTQIFAEMRNRLDNGAVSADQACRALPGFDRVVYATFRNCQRTANANMTTSGAMVPIARGTVYAYYRNVAYKPDAEIYHLVDADFTVALTDTNDYDYLTPTVFDIGAAAVDIHLDASYCPIAINEFDLIQYADKKAKVYDRAGNLIFDGTNLGAGIYHFTCSFVPLKSLTIKNTAETYTIVVPERDLKNFYTGECSGDYNTEKWTVKQQSLVV